MDDINDARERVITAAKALYETQETSPNTNPPGVRGIAGQAITGWVRAERVNDLLEATDVLMRLERRAEMDARTAEAEIEFIKPIK